MIYIDSTNLFACAVSLSQCTSIPFEVIVAAAAAAAVDFVVIWHCVLKWGETSSFSIVGCVY